MPGKRADSFKIALDTVRGELRSGRHAPDARLTAITIAERLDLSQTPVREALSRLAGEGLLLDRRGQGYFVPRLAAHDIALLFHLLLAGLRIAAAAQTPVQTAAQSTATARDPERRVPAAEAQAVGVVIAGEMLLRGFAARASPVSARHLNRLHDQLARVRAGEPQILDDLPSELAGLRAAFSSGDLEIIGAALDAFVARRIAVAPELARFQDDPANIESI